MSSSIYPPSQALFTENLSHLKQSVLAAAAAIRLNRNQLLSEFKDRDSESLKNDLRNIFHRAIQEMYLSKIELTWNKVCKGHGFKFKSQLKKKKTRMVEEQAKLEFSNKHYIKPASVYTEVCGKYDVYVYFKYINNCPRCHCETDLIEEAYRLGVAEILTQAEDHLQKQNIDLEDFYVSLWGYVFDH